jgi:hypothetical protein
LPVKAELKALAKAGTLEGYAVRIVATASDA